MRATIAVLSVLGALCTGCTEGQKRGDVGDPCPCKEGLVCQEGICVDLPCNGECNPQTEACIDDQCVPVGDPNDKDGDGSVVGVDCDDFNREIHPEAQEVCDGIDNDCDDLTDENCPACPEGENRTCGTDVGECTQGVQECLLGRWQACSGAGPVPEICDAKDNDCDGLTDEICPCEEGEELPCGVDEGECAAGFQACEGGEWTGCKNGELPVEETCDGLDNDCDGLTDEGFPMLCGCEGNLDCPIGHRCENRACRMHEFRSFGSGAVVYTTPAHRVQLFVGPESPVGDASSAVHAIRLGPGAIRNVQ